MNGPGLFLLRKDPALKGLLPSVPLLTLVGLAIRFSAGENIGELSSPGWSGFTIFLFIVVWCVILFYATGTGFWSRCSRLVQALPIGGRQVWAWRTLAMTVAISLPVAAMTLAIGAGNDRGVLLLGGKVLTTALLLLAVAQNPFPKLSRIPVRAVYVVFLVFLSFLALVYLLITPSTPSTILIPAGLALLIGIRTFAAVPPGFLAAPDRPGHADGSRWWRWLEPPEEQQPPVQPATAAVEGSPPLTFRQVLHMTLFRTLLNRFNVWLFGLLLIFISWAMIHEFYSGPGHWLALLYSSVWLLVHFRQSPQWIEPLASLPIPRVLIYRFVAGAMIIPILAGAGLSLLLIYGNRPVLVNLDDRRGIELRVPYEFWETGAAGESYTAVAPWGESLQLTLHPLAPGSGTLVFNPYAVTEESSDRFVAWQQARAIQAVYELDALPDPEDPQVPPGARSRLHNRTWGLGLLMLSLFLVGGVIFSLQQPRTRSGRVLSIAFIPMLGLLIGLVILAMIAGPAFGWATTQALDAGPLLLLAAVAGRIGLSGPAYLVLSILVLGAGYILVGRVFRKVEPDHAKAKSIGHDYRF